MKRLYFTADVDRDVNFQIYGQAAAGSLDRGSGAAPRFSSSERGLGIMMDMLDGLGIRGTLFFEGRTSETIDCSPVSGHCVGIHGYDHEDLTSLTNVALKDVMRSSFDAVRDNVGRPVCHRAPYMMADDRVLDVLRRCTPIRRDSSFYSLPGDEVGPYARGTVIEFPVAKRRDPAGRTMAMYLWPMHEGKRSPEEYIRMAETLGDTVVIADHSWHYVETRASGPMGAEWERENTDRVRRVLEGMMDLGYEARTLARA